MQEEEEEEDEEDYRSLHDPRLDPRRYRTAHGHATGIPNQNNEHLNLPAFPQRTARMDQFVPGPVFQEQPLGPHPNATDTDAYPAPSLEADGAPSMASQTVDVPYTSRPVVSEPDNSTCGYPTSESSHLGSPGRKYEEFAPNTPSDRSALRYRDRRYTPADINTSTFHGRLATFHVRNWPIRFMDKRLLAKLGFYYEGDGDEVVCSGCGRSLRGWQPRDDPWVEHHNNFEEDCFEPLNSTSA